MRRWCKFWNNPSRCLMVWLHNLHVPDFYFHWDPTLARWKYCRLIRFRILRSGSTFECGTCQFPNLPDFLSTLSKATSAHLLPYWISKFLKLFMVQWDGILERRIHSSRSSRLKPSESPLFTIWGSNGAQGLTIHFLCLTLNLKLVEIWSVNNFKIIMWSPSLDFEWSSDR